MTPFIVAKRIGYRQAFKAITVGLLIAYGLMAETAGVFWILDFRYNLTLLFTAFVLYGFGYLVGGSAGKLIIINNYPAVAVGILSGFLIILAATFVGSLIGFFKEGLPNHSSLSNTLEDYILRPLMMVSLGGFLPIAGIGIWYGLSIRRKGRRLNTNSRLAGTAVDPT